MSKVTVDIESDKPTIKIDNVRMSFPSIAKPGEDYSSLEAQMRDHAEAVARAHSRRSLYSDMHIPQMWPGQRLDLGDRRWWPVGPTIPPLDVPDAPSEPEAVVEPESASVQMLRKLLADRRGELAREQSAKKDTVETIENLKVELASEEADLAQHERHIAAAQDSIDEVLADIKALGGRDESAE